MNPSRPAILCLGLILLVLAVYANHFHNGFHFDDSHAIVDNAFIRDLRNVPRFFTDTSISSTLPDHLMYRPLVSASLAIDYRLGGGLAPLWFHISTFFWFAVQLVMMFFLYRRLLDAAGAAPSSQWTALAATAIYGLHPAIAETVNYVIQRADLYSTLGVVASLLWFAARPAQRRYGWYLIPAVAAYLAKAPALIYPLLLAAYVALFEERARLIRDTLPAFAVTGAAAVLTAVMTPRTFNAGAASGALYRITQPWVALHYFVSFFLPTGLSADSDWGYVPGVFSAQALAGYAFVIALVFAAVKCARHRATRPIAFGIVWFLLALLPTSLMPLAEVTNDHRMYFPFVGLALAVVSALRLALLHLTAPSEPRASASGMEHGTAPSRSRLGTNASEPRASASGTAHRTAPSRSRLGMNASEPRASASGLEQGTAPSEPRASASGMTHRALRHAAIAGLILVLAAEAVGTRARNRVWRDDESLWRDVTLKSPRNGRGLMNYGLVFMARGDYPSALQLFDRALALTPNYGTLEINLGIATGALHRDADAARHFERAIALTPQSADPYAFYGAWLQSTGRAAAAVAPLETALRLNPNSFAARHSLMAAYSGLRNWPALDRLAAETLQLAPLDEPARQYAAARATRGTTTPADEYLSLSEQYYRAGKWDDSIHAAQEAIRLRPDDPAARTNLLRAMVQRAKERSSRP